MLTCVIDQAVGGDQGHDGERALGFRVSHVLCCLIKAEGDFCRFLLSMPDLLARPSLGLPDTGPIEPIHSWAPPQAWVPKARVQPIVRGTHNVKVALELRDKHVD